MVKSHVFCENDQWLASWASKEGKVGHKRHDLAAFVLDLRPEDAKKCSIWPNSDWNQRKRDFVISFALFYWFNCEFYMILTFLPHLHQFVTLFRRKNRFSFRSTSAFWLTKNTLVSHSLKLHMSYVTFNYYIIFKIVVKLTSIRQN